MKTCFPAIALPLQQLLSPAGDHRPLAGHGKRCVRSIWAVNKAVQQCSSRTSDFLRGGYLIRKRQGIESRG